MLRALPALAVMIISLTFSAAAQEATSSDLAADKLMDKTTPAFTCNAQTEGQLTCQANRQCECQYRPAEAGRPARWAWDCGIKRPRCEMTPAEAGEGTQALPPVIIEHKGRGKEEDEGGN